MWLTKKYCQGVSQVPLAMKKKKTLALFSLSVVIKFFIESIIQTLIEPIFIRHCPESWNDHNDELQIATSLSHFANWSVNYKGIKMTKL